MNLHNSITLFLDPSSSVAKKTRATALGLTDYVHEIDLRTEKMTPTRWRQILDALGMPPKQILNKAHPRYQRYIRGRTFSDQDWLFILVNHPEMLRAPIALQGKKAVLCENPNDIYKIVRRVAV